MSVSVNAFLQGLWNSFNQTGGASRLSSLAARKLAGGKYYDPYTDPIFLQDYQNALAMGSPVAYKNFIKNYGDYLTYQIPEEGPRPLTYEEQAVQIFGDRAAQPLTINPRLAAAAFAPDRNWDWLPESMPLSQFKNVFGEGALLVGPERYARTAEGDYNTARGYYWNTKGDIEQENLTDLQRTNDWKWNNTVSFGDVLTGMGYTGDVGPYAGIKMPITMLPDMVDVATVPSEIGKIGAEEEAAKALAGEREAHARNWDAQTALEKFNLDLAQSQVIDVGKALKDMGIKAPSFNGVQMDVNDFLGKLSNIYQGLKHKSEVMTEEQKRQYVIDKLKEEIATEKAKQATEGAQKYMYQQHGNLYGEQAETETALKGPRIKTEEQRAAELASRILANKALAGERQARTNQITALTQPMVDYYNRRSINTTDNFGPEDIVFYQNNDPNRPVYRSKLGILLDSNFMPLTNEEGKPLMMDKDGNIIPIDIPDIGEGGEGFNIFKWAFPIGGTGWFSQSETQPTTSTQQPKVDINTIIQEYKNEYNMTSTELADSLEAQSDEFKKQFRKKYGVSVAEVINRLRQMKY